MEAHQAVAFESHEFERIGGGVPSDNAHAERMLRPAAIVRKNSHANGSEDGAATPSVLMSVFRTPKQRGHHPVATVINALRTASQTRQLPPLPEPTTGSV